MQICHLTSVSSSSFTVAGWKETLDEQKVVRMKYIKNSKEQPWVPIKVLSQNKGGTLGSENVDA